MDKRIAILGVVVSLVPRFAQAAPPSDAAWVLLGLDIHMGAVTMRDTTADADTVSVYGEGLPVYQDSGGLPGRSAPRDPKICGPIACGGEFRPVPLRRLADLGKLDPMSMPGPPST